jgi:hypothetical protein
VSQANAQVNESKGIRFFFRRLARMSKLAVVDGVSANSTTSALESITYEEDEKSA